MTNAATKPETRPFKFKEGDRVKLWGKSKDVGTVDDTWFDGPKEVVAVVWDVSGCVSDVPAYRLQHAA